MWSLEKRVIAPGQLESHVFLAAADRPEETARWEAGRQPAVLSYMHMSI